MRKVQKRTESKATFLSSNSSKATFLSSNSFLSKMAASEAVSGLERHLSDLRSKRSDTNHGLNVLSERWGSPKIGRPGRATSGLLFGMGIIPAGYECGRE